MKRAGIAGPDFKAVRAERRAARDQAQLENARADLARYKDLVAKEAAPRQQLDTQTALVRQLEATLLSDQAAVDNARLQLSYTRVTAPISGQAGLKQADLGNNVSPGDANGLLTIAQTQPAAVVFAVPDARLARIRQQLADLLGDEVLVAGQVGAGVFQLGLVAGQRRLGLVAGDLVGPRVDQREHLAGLHRLALMEVERLELAAHLGPHDRRVGRGDAT